MLNDIANMLSQQKEIVEEYEKLIGVESYITNEMQEIQNSINNLQLKYEDLVSQHYAVANKMEELIAQMEIIKCHMSDVLNNF